MSEMASPAAVVAILITQKRAVTSGTFAASGCWVNTLRSVRTLVGSPSGWGRVAREENGRGPCFQRCCCAPW